LASDVEAAVLVKPGTFELRRFPIPKIGPDSGLLRVELAGVCGTDLKIFHGTYLGRLGNPLIPGHEICGIVDEIGEQAAERWGVQKGDRVAVDSFLACGSCDACLSGETRYCEGLGDYGVSMSAGRPPYLWGGFSQLVYLHPGAQVYRLGTLSPALGVLVPAVLGNAIRWVSDIGRVRVGSTVLVSGPGAIGLACVAVAKELGASLVIVTGLSSDAHRLALAQSLGADQALLADSDLETAVLDLTEGTGVDAVIEVSGSVEAMALAPRLTRRQGIVVFGGLSGGRPASLSLDDVALREIELRGVFSHDRASIKRALRFAETNGERFEGFITDVFPLARVVDAIEILERRPETFVKAAVAPAS
jgi:alcohol dehydrogenase